MLQEDVLGAIRQSQQYFADYAQFDDEMEVIKPNFRPQSPGHLEGCAPSICWMFNLFVNSFFSLRSTAPIFMDGWMDV